MISSIPADVPSLELSVRLSRSCRWLGLWKSGDGDEHVQPASHGLRTHDKSSMTNIYCRQDEQKTAVVYLPPGRDWNETLEMKGLINCCS